jgi:putative nucleotidyltransferase with HDIG domain
VINDEDADARKIARVIQADPAITAKLISTANSTFYRRARGIESCTDAVVRLGPSAVRNLVTAFVMRGLFQSRVPVIQHHVKHLWTHSAMVAAISFNLARATPGMNADTALLAGLLHDIGSLCVLGYAERHPELYKSTEQLATTIATFRGQLGAEILRRWDLPQAIVNAARDAEDWQRNPKPEADYSDLVLISQLHLIADEERLWSMPRLYEVPAFQKMASGRLGPNLSLMVLDEAKQYIDETAGWLMH